jgi:hypothetical protein
MLRPPLLVAGQTPRADNTEMTAPLMVEPHAVAPG